MVGLCFMLLSYTSTEEKSTASFCLLANSNRQFGGAGYFSGLSFSWSPTNQYIEMAALSAASLLYM